MFTLKHLVDLINNVDALVIGAGSGLSTAAGFEYDGKTFLEHFQYMYDLYGYTDMYSAGFHKFKSLNEKWGYWSKFIYLNRYATGALPLYVKIVDLIKDKNYFVITTNVDHQFQKANIDKTRLFYTQGDYGLFQCSVPCLNKTYDNKEKILKMINNQTNHLINDEVIPYCPNCNKPLNTNLRADKTFVQDEGWYSANKRYAKFIEDNTNKKILFLELGVGLNTPGIIKYPFINMTYQSEDAQYVSISNEHILQIPKEIENKSILIEIDLKKFFEL